MIPDFVPLTTTRSPIWKSSVGSACTLSAATIKTAVKIMRESDQSNLT